MPSAQPFFLSYSRPPLNGLITRPLCTCPGPATSFITIIQFKLLDRPWPPFTHSWNASHPFQPYPRVSMLMPPKPSRGRRRPAYGGCWMQLVAGGFTQDPHAHAQAPRSSQRTAPTFLRCAGTGRYGGVCGECAARDRRPYAGSSNCDVSAISVTLWRSSISASRAT